MAAIHLEQNITSAKPVQDKIEIISSPWSASLKRKYSLLSPMSHQQSLQRNTPQTYGSPTRTLH